MGVPSPPFHGLGKRERVPHRLPEKVEHAPLSSLGCGQDSPTPASSSVSPKLQLEPPMHLGITPARQGAGALGGGSPSLSPGTRGLACGQSMVLLMEE